MTRLIPADKGTHFVLGSVLTLLALLLAGPAGAVSACVLAAVGREVYGWWRRGWRMAWADAGESLADIGATLLGGLVVLAATLGA